MIDVVQARGFRILRKAEWGSGDEASAFKSVLERHSFGIYGLLPGDAIEPGERPAIVVLVALRESTFHVSGRPREPD